MAAKHSGSGRPDSTRRRRIFTVTVIGRARFREVVSDYELLELELAFS
jgi:hypothetical protein